MRPSVAESYAAAREITREQARNFHYGIRLLPSERRDALCALYALSRRVDDIGDGDVVTDDRGAALERVRTDLHRAAATGTADDPVLAAVVDAAARFPVPLGAFDELIDGVRMDVDGRRYDTFDDLVDYCRCVAGAIGRLCLGVFGHREDPDAALYADQLGIALQQVNILRDIREDLRNGRVYLPAEDLDRFGVTLAVHGPGEVLAAPGSPQETALVGLIRFAAARARRWYLDGLRLLPLLDRRSAACCAAMSGIYWELLNRIEADPRLVFDRRLSLSGRQKAAVALSSLAGRKLVSA